MLSLALLLSFLAPPAARPQEAVLAFENAHWYDGQEFVHGTRFVSGGSFLGEASGPIGMRIDLRGQWVVPPFGEAHTHILETETIELYVDHYVHRGIFYVQDQANFPWVRRHIDPVFARVDTPDFRSANQGFTGPGGHPLQIARQVHAAGLLPATWSTADLEREAVFVVETQEEIDAVWPGFLEDKPDFVKLFLLYSELHGERSGHLSHLYRCGMDPALVGPLVERAHAADLEVSAHIYTRADFRTAVDAGVDLIAHFPGVGYDPLLGDEAFLLTEEDARAAAAQGVEVCTTLADMTGAPGPYSRATRELVDRVIVPNLDRLQEADVPLVIGADLVRRTTDVEARALLDLELFDPATLLHLWAVRTPRHIFPERRIGRLAPGYEASFLVLEGNPLEDWANTARISLRLKQGRILVSRDPVFPRSARRRGADSHRATRRRKPSSSAT